MEFINIFSIREQLLEDEAERAADPKKQAEHDAMIEDFCREMNGPVGKVEGGNS